MQQPLYWLEPDFLWLCQPKAQNSESEWAEERELWRMCRRLYALIICIYFIVCGCAFVSSLNIRFKSHIELASLALIWWYCVNFFDLIAYLCDWFCGAPRLPVATTHHQSQTNSASHEWNVPLELLSARCHLCFDLAAESLEIGLFITRFQSILCRMSKCFRQTILDKMRGLFTTQRKNAVHSLNSTWYKAFLLCSKISIKSSLFAFSCTIIRLI